MKNWWTKHWQHVILGLILVLAAFLRLYRLDTLPLGLHDDEVWNTYFGRYILQNGHDLHGRATPLLYTDKFGDYPPVLPMYLSGLATYLLGVNALASRVPFAVIGIITVWLTYQLLKWLCRSPAIGLLGAIFLAVCPWHMILSRASAENVFGVLVFIWGAYWLCQSLEEPKFHWKLVAGTVLLFATYLLYPSYRVIVPVWLLGTVLASKKGWQRKTMIGIAVIALGLTLAISQTTWGRGRYDQVSVMTSDTVAGKSLNYSLALGPGQVPRARVFNNRYVLAAREFLRQYASYFSPQYLTGEGWIEPQRYNLVEHGMAYWMLVVVIGAAVGAQFIWPQSAASWTKIFQANRGKYALLFGWFFLLAGVPGALTLEEVPNIHRTLGMAIGWAGIFGLAAYALVTIYARERWQRATAVIIGLGLTVEVIYFWHTYTGLTYESTFVYRDDAKQKLAAQLLAWQDEYEAIYLPDAGNLALHYLFATGNFDPALTGQFDEQFQVTNLGNLYFVTQPCAVLAEQTELGTMTKGLAVSFSERCEDINAVELEEVTTIRRANETEAYYVYTAHEATGEGTIAN